MTMNFNSFAAFAVHLGKIPFKQVEKEGLEIAAKVIEAAAKKEIGTYQRDDVGPFDPWKELADSTKADRLRQGYTENDPLLRSGAMRDSISHYIDPNGHDAYVGSPSQILVWQEYGTDRIPPRSVLGIAAFRNKDLIKKLVGTLALSSLVNGVEVPMFFDEILNATENTTSSNVDPNQLGIGND